MTDLIWHRAIQSGFEPIETPVLEYAETLLGSGGDEADKEVYLFEDHGGRSVGLRFDLTVPFSRYVAEHQGTLAMPFKRVQIGIPIVVRSLRRAAIANFVRPMLISLGLTLCQPNVEVLQNIVSNLNDIVPASF